MRASSSHCSARRSISAIRSPARPLAFVTPGSRRATRASRATRRRPRALDRRQQLRVERRELAQRRNRGGPAVVEPVRRGRSAPHGARNASSSCRMRALRTSASAQKRFLPARARSRPRRPALPATCAATSVTPAARRSSHCRAAAIVAGRESYALSRSRCRRTSGAGAGRRRRRRACAGCRPDLRTSADP